MVNHVTVVVKFMAARFIAVGRAARVFLILRVGLLNGRTKKNTAVTSLWLLANVII